MNFYPPNRNILKYAFLTAVLAAAPTAFGQTLTVIGGQGQLVPSSGLAQTPISVQLLDATGQPIANQVISFVSQNPAAGNPTQPTVITDATGTASVGYIAAALFNTFQPYASNVVYASSNVISAAIYITTIGQVNGGGNAVTAKLASPPQGTSIAGPAGSTSLTPIQISVIPTVNGIGSGVPYVSLVVTFDSSTGTGTFTCKEGSTILTDASGNATCTPVFGKVGTGTYIVTIGGGFTQFPNLPFQVTVGPPALVQITAGNNQSGSPGATLPLPLVAVVTDLGGNPIPGVNMAFTSITPGGATFINIRNSF